MAVSGVTMKMTDACRSTLRRHEHDPRCSECHVGRMAHGGAPSRRTSRARRRGHVTRTRTDRRGRRRVRHGAPRDAGVLGTDERPVDDGRQVPHGGRREQDRRHGPRHLCPRDPRAAPRGRGHARPRPRPRRARRHGSDSRSVRTPHRGGHRQDRRRPARRPVTHPGGSRDGDARRPPRPLVGPPRARRRATGSPAPTIRCSSPWCPGS